MQSLHGDDVETCGFDVRYNFSSNVAQPQHQSRYVHALNQLALHKYPHPTPLQTMLAKQHSLLPEQLLLTNGASEAIYLIAQLYQRSHSHIITPTFVEYERACMVNQHKMSFASTWQPSDLLWLCNPNNPDGSVSSVADISRWLSAHPEQTLIIDQSYAYQLPELDATALLEQFDNLLIINSLTKSLAIPALRLGYVMANKGVIKKLAERQPSWSVNGAALAVAGHALAQPDQAPSTEPSSTLQKAIAALPGVQVRPSPTSYFLFQTHIPATQLKQKLGQGFGILVRDASNIRGCSKHCVRVCSQGEQANQALVSALAEILAVQS